MECWTSLIAPLTVGALTCLGITVWGCLCRNVDNTHSLEVNIGLLRTALEDLNDKRKAVVIKVDDRVRKGGKQEAEVARWISKVRAFETDTRRLLDDASVHVDSAVDRGCWSTDSISECCLGQKVSKKLNEAIELTRRGENYSASKQDPPVVEEKFFETPAFGLRTSLDKAWDSLKKDKNKLVGIYGMGGIGKTTLLALINNKFATVEDQYDIVIWVEVSKAGDIGIQDNNQKTQVDVERIQDRIGERLHLCDERWSNYTKAKKTVEICKALELKPRFVLLLDDLWEDVSLADIGLPLRGTGQYRVVFTTRSEKVCGLMRANDKIEVELLGDTDAFDLFKEFANSSGSSNEISDDVAKKIVAECDGLPLALKVIGKTMSSKTSPDKWSRALEDLKFYPGELDGTEKLYKVLKLSFDYLEENQAKCFQYCALFPKAYSIKRDELVEYWIGEGLIDVSLGRDRAKSSGYNIIDTLVGASLLQKKGESEMMKVSMHDSIRDMVLWVRSKNSIFKDGEIFVVETSGKLSKLPDPTDWTTVSKMSLMNNQINGIADGYEFPNPNRLVTLFLQNNKLVDIVGKFFRALSTLVVLDLSHNPNITELPNEISTLVALRYLSLLGTMIKDLPEGFEKLTKLIHLDLESTPNLQRIRVSSVSGLLKLQVLRFYDSQASLDVSLLEHLKRLESLQVLTITVRKVDVLEAFLGSDLENKTYGMHLEGLKTSVASYAVTFGRLENLRNLMMINCDIIIQHNTPSTSSNQITASNTWFKNLSAVVVSSCPDLKDLTWLIYAANLESLSITILPKMEEVISQQKAQDVGVEPFLKLQFLELGYLDELNGIYWCPLSFPRMPKLFITECPKLPLNSISVQHIDDLLIRRS